jgi:soluble lytic murein transglycosylase-like protein
VDPELIRAIIRVESAYDTKAVSNKGAMGLMQLVPATAQRFGVADPFDPKQNLEGGVNYLKYLLDHFGGDLDLSLAAYNAGEHTVQRSGGIPAIPETQNYVRKINKLYQPADVATTAKATPREPPATPITRFVDNYGVVHFSNLD